MNPIEKLKREVIEGLSQKRIGVVINPTDRDIFIKTVIDHLHAAGLLMVWMPIDEKTPIDGSQFLAYIPDGVFSGACQGYCMDDGHFVPLFGDDNIEPTHWMPKPPEPEKEGV